jgi:flavin reductase (DIM6/NTAB) family NADH-FMN oxidoreductase RutF
MTASFVMPVSFEPKYIAVAISPKRYTFQNLKEVKEMTINICDTNMKEAAKICGSYSGKDADKFELAKLTAIKSSKISVPWIKEAPVSFECVVEDMHEYGDHYIVVGRVVEEHIQKKDFVPLSHVSGERYIMSY